MKRSILITTAEQGFKLIFQLLTVYLVARSVEPEAFGWSALTTILISSLTLVTQIGIEPYLISAANISQSRNDKVFTLVFLVSFLLFLSSILISMLYISDFNLRVVLIGGSLGSFIWSTGAVSRAMLNRSEDFSEIAKIGVFSSILYFISSVSLANLQGSGTLALIGGQVISIFGTSFLTIRASKLKVRFSLPRRVNVEAVHFFKNTGISGFSNFLARNLDSVLIYISLGVTSLAFYDRAYIIVLNIQLALSQIFSRVFLPKFATHSGDLAAKYLSGLKIYAQFSMFLSTISILFSDRIVTTLLSNGYESTASLLPILAFGGFLQSLSSLSGVLLLSKRRTSTLLKISGISALVYATAFLSVFLFSTSLLHYAFATCISALVVLMIVMIYLPSTVDNLTLSNQLKCVLPSLATVAVSFALSSYLNQH